MWIGYVPVETSGARRSPWSQIGQWAWQLESLRSKAPEDCQFQIGKSCAG
jgi:hypothetical protein